MVKRVSGIHAIRAMINAVDLDRLIMNGPDGPVPIPWMILPPTEMLALMAPCLTHW